jgi:hypothetical protein
MLDKILQEYFSKIPGVTRVRISTVFGEPVKMSVTYATEERKGTLLFQIEGLKVAGIDLHHPDAFGQLEDLVVKRMYE